MARKGDSRVADRLLRLGRDSAKAELVKGRILSLGTLDDGTGWDMKVRLACASAAMPLKLQTQQMG